MDDAPILAAPTSAEDFLDRFGVACQVHSDPLPGRVLQVPETALPPLAD